MVQGIRAGNLILAPSLALAAGLLHAAALAAPWDKQPHGWMQPLALGVLAALLRSAPSAR